MKVYEVILVESSFYHSSLQLFSDLDKAKSFVQEYSCKEKFHKIDESTYGSKWDDYGLLYGIYIKEREIE